MPYRDPFSNDLLSDDEMNSFDPVNIARVLDSWPAKNSPDPWQPTTADKIIAHALGVAL